MKRSFLLILLALCAGAASANTISGKVTKDTTGNPAYPAEAYLIHKTYNSSTSSYVLTLLDSTATNSNGEYHFDSVSYAAGDLLIKAFLTTANPDYSHYLPTYKENSLNWSTAHAASFTLGTNNIHLQHGTNTGGPAFIGGSVLLGANKTTAVGDPLPQRLVLITTGNDEPVGYTYSDAAGQFSFSGLSYGTYKLFGDALGKDNPPLTITVSASNPTVNDIIFEENSHNFTGKEQATSVSNVTVNNVKIYPNPATATIMIEGAASGTVLTISDMMGRVLSKQVLDQQTATINIAALTPGQYVFILNNNGALTHYNVTRN